MPRVPPHAQYTLRLAASCLARSPAYPVGLWPCLDGPDPLRCPEVHASDDSLPHPQGEQRPLTPCGFEHPRLHTPLALMRPRVVRAHVPVKSAQLMPFAVTQSRIADPSKFPGSLLPPIRRNAHGLRPAGQRPASRRLSRKSSAPERTKPFFSEPKGGEERSSFRGRMTRLSRKRLAGHRPPSPFPLRYSILGGHDSERHFGLNSRLPRLFQPLTSASLPRSHRPPANSPPRRGAHSALRRPTQHGFAVSGASRQVQRGPEDQS